MSLESNKQSFWSPWLVILLMAPVFVAIALIFYFKLNQQKSDFNEVTSYFVERQNTVLAHDAMRVAHRVRQLLSNAVQDLHTLSLLKPTAKEFQKFYNVHKNRISVYDRINNTVQMQDQPIYSEMNFLNKNGEEIVRVLNGRPASNYRNLNDCKTSKLCDQKLRNKMLNLNIGKIQFGKLLRYYTTREVEEDYKGAKVSIAIKLANGILELGIDYKHFREILYEPTFPYEPRRQLLQSYLDGNYIYYVDDKFDFIAHPKHWHVVGIDKTTGINKTAVVTDDMLGFHPVNVKTYSGEQLKDYFNRLVSLSFSNNKIDIFKAPNLTGKIRVHAVAPILFQKGQYQQTGVFGYVVIGCYVDYFEEPKEQFLPYY